MQRDTQVPQTWMPRAADLTPSSLSWWVTYLIYLLTCCQTTDVESYIWLTCLHRWANYLLICFLILYVLKENDIDVGQFFVYFILWDYEAVSIFPFCLTFVLQLLLPFIPSSVFYSIPSLIFIFSHFDSSILYLPYSIDSFSLKKTIFTAKVESYDRNTKKTVRGKLSLVDLAGSERADKTGGNADRLKEGQSINKSLSALGDVMAALSEGGKAFVPYRNNKLTQLMQDSLGGNAKTLMFVNFSPADYNADETVTSLNFATRVKKVINNASKVSAKLSVNFYRIYWLLWFVVSVMIYRIKRHRPSADRSWNILWKRILWRITLSMFLTNHFSSLHYSKRKARRWEDSKWLSRNCRTSWLVPKVEGDLGTWQKKGRTEEEM